MQSQSCHCCSTDYSDSQADDDVGDDVGDDDDDDDDDDGDDDGDDSFDDRNVPDEDHDDDGGGDGDMTVQAQRLRWLPICLIKKLILISLFAYTHRLDQTRQKRGGERERDQS